MDSEPVSSLPTPVNHSMMNTSSPIALEGNENNEIKMNIEMDQVLLNGYRMNGFSENTYFCDAHESQTFFKGCKWSPDEVGNRILTCNGNSTLTAYHTFLNRLNYSSSQISEEKFELRNFGKIYDYDWYPAVTSSQYYAIIAGSLGPLHVYDFMSKRSVASYQMYSRNDEIVHAHCVACSGDGSTIIGGTANYIFLFDVNRPGRTHETIWTRPHFNKGIISTISVNPVRPSLFAVGSYNNRVGLYDGTDFLCMLLGHVKGVTQVKFSPDGTYLLSGTRGDGCIICWDLRNPGTALFRLERVVKTQQRIYFDISACNRYIVSGSTDGDVYIWDSKLSPVDDILLPIHKFEAHQDCCNGISLHSQLPFLATASGQYHHPELIHSLLDSDDDKGTVVEYDKVIENKLKLWHMDISTM